MISYLQQAFNGGAFSPLLHHRDDLQKFRSGLRVGDNLIATPYGPTSKRGGMLYVTDAVNGITRESRLEPWIISADSGYMLEFSHETCRVFRYGAVVLDGMSAEVEFVTPFQEDELFKFQFIQINDIGYFVHPNHKPHKLSRFSDDTWTFEETDWSYPPLRDENVTDISITPSAKTGSITLTASSAFFDAGHVGANIEIGHLRGAGEYESKIDLNADGTSPELLVQNEYSFFTQGNWNATVTIERYDEDSASWVADREFKSAKDRNFEITGFRAELTRMRIVVTDKISTSSADALAVLQVSEGTLKGLVEITAVASATSATATVINRLSSTGATKIWRESAFSDYRGYPRTVGIHDLRIVYGGTRTDRQTIWGSASDDFEEFKVGTNDADSFKLTIASGAHDEIEWLLSQKSLLAGTSGGEWVVSAGRSDDVITPSNARARRQSNYGSEHIQALVVDDAALFLRTGAERLAEMAFFFEKDGYASKDLTLLSYDVGNSGFKQFAYRRKRDPAIFGVTNDGKLAVMTYNRGQEVSGWTEIKTDGFVESVAVLSRAGDEDEVWFVVQRELGDGTPVRYIERFDPDAWDKVESGDLTMCFVDSAVIYDSTATTTITGLGHLEGKTVAILADGANHPRKVVSSGEIALEYAASEVVVGLPYSSVFIPLPLGGQGRSGALIGREYKINELVMFFYRTISAKYARRGADDDDFTDIPFRTTTGNYGEPIGLFTGHIKVKSGGRHAIDEGIEIRSDEPFPFTLVSLVTKYDVHGE